MHKILKRIARDDRGQDLIEYALMGGFVAAAAGAVMPGISQTIGKMITKASVGGMGFEDSTIRIVSALLAAVFLGLIILRRKNDTNAD